MRHERLPILTEVKRQGQPYIDEPVYNHLNPQPLAVMIPRAFAQYPMAPEVLCRKKIEVIEPKVPQTIHVLVAYQHTKLRWVKPC